MGKTVSKEKYEDLLARKNCVALKLGDYMRRCLMHNK